MPRFAQATLEMHRRGGYRVQEWPSPDGSKGYVYVQLELYDPAARPYFLKDSSVTVRELRVRLKSAKGREWCRLAGTVLREAKPDDAVQFIQLQQIVDHWEGLAGYLGAMRVFWAWLLKVHDEPVRRNGYGLYDSLLARFWKAQGFSTWTTHALLHSGIRSWADLESRTRQELLKLPYFGKVGVARIEELRSRRDHPRTGP